MENLIAQITKKITGIQGCKFASLTYLSKSSGEIARYTVVLGFSYHNLVLKSVTELEILISENAALPAEHADKWNTLQVQAAQEVMNSLKKTLDAHSRGEQNEDYTKKDQYIPFGNGCNVNTTDNTIQLFGLLQSKVTIRPGEFKTVNSRPLTIAKKAIQNQLSISKFREFALDLSQLDEEDCKVRVNGETFEIEPNVR